MMSRLIFLFAALLGAGAAVAAAERPRDIVERQAEVVLNTLV